MIILKIKQYCFNNSKNNAAKRSNSVDPDQTGSTLFAQTCLFENLGLLSLVCTMRLIYEINFCGSCIRIHCRTHSTGTPVIQGSWYYFTCCFPPLKLFLRKKWQLRKLWKCCLSIWSLLLFQCKICNPWAAADTELLDEEVILFNSQ